MCTAFSLPCLSLELGGTRATWELMKTRLEVLWHGCLSGDGPSLRPVKLLDWISWARVRLQLVAAVDRLKAWLLGPGVLRVQA